MQLLDRDLKQLFPVNHLYIRELTPEERINEITARLRNFFDNLIQFRNRPRIGYLVRSGRMISGCLFPGIGGLVFRECPLPLSLVVVGFVGILRQESIA